MMSLNISNNNCPISNKRKWQIILGGKQGYTGWWQHLEARVNVASKQLRRGQWCLSMNAAWSSFLFFPFSCVHLQRSVRLKMIIARCGFETGERQGCQTEGWTGAWINGQPGYFHMGWQSEPMDHRSLARRSNSRVPSAWDGSEAKRQKGGEGERGEWDREAINVDWKTYFTIAAGKGSAVQVSPAVSQTSNLTCQERHDNMAAKDYGQMCLPKMVFLYKKTSTKIVCNFCLIFLNKKWTQQVSFGCSRLT